MPGSSHPRKGFPPKFQQISRAADAGLAENICRTVTMFCGALSMATELFSIVLTYHGPLGKAVQFHLYGKRKKQ
jgi:hypothetical protein